MIVKDLLIKSSYKKIESKIKLHYGENELPSYKKLYFKLLNLKIDSVLDTDLYIFINAYKETEDEDILVEIFNEDDTTLYFDVSGYELNESMIYSIAASSYSDFLQYKIDEKTLGKFSYESILAHCFYEVTAYGFEDNI